MEPKYRTLIQAAVLMLLFVAAISSEAPTKDPEPTAQVASAER